MVNQMETGRNPEGKSEGIRKENRMENRKETG